MALLEVVNDDVCSLDEFCAWVDRSPGRLARIADWPELWSRFYSLRNDRHLLTRFLNRSQDDIAAFQRSNRYSGQTFLLVRKPGYYIRANVWPVALPGGSEVPEEHFNRFYVYGERYAHDHNFDFLTVGYFGPGYVTDLYSYDNTNVQGVVGEEVGLRFEGRRTLTERTMLLFEQGKDVHIQYPPEQMTVSLNFIPDLGRPKLTQFMFDVATSRIAKMQLTGNRSSNLDLLVDEIGTEEVRRIHAARRAGYATRDLEAKTARGAELV